jgi:flavin-dependent dehydrogenase
MKATNGTADLSAENLIVGGGPAGSMLALRLAAAGRRATLIEREAAAHDKVCGEFLSREAVHYLRQAGLDPLALGAQVIHSVRLSSGDKVVSSPLPFEALSLSRRALDEALLTKATQTCEVRRGITVESLRPIDDHWIAHLTGGQTLRASDVFLATGKHDLRGFARPAGRQGDLVGFKLHFSLGPAKIDALRESMDLYLFPGGYGGLSLIEGDAANLCLVVRRSVFQELGGWPHLIENILQGNLHLRWLLDGATPLISRPLAISPIPYGYLAAESDGLWCIGDQVAVIPSFTGDGMSIAMHSATLAAQMFTAGRSSAEYTAALRAQIRRQMSLATWLSQACVTSAGRAAALSFLPLAPMLLRWIAAATRIPPSSLLYSMGSETSREPQEMHC